MKKVCATGPGSARPVVSITTRSNLSSPWSRFSLQRRRGCGSGRRARCSRCSRCSSRRSALLDFTRMSLSTPVSPNSFSITAIFWPCSSLRMRLSRVVLPAPRKPVRMVTGMRAMECSGGGIGKVGKFSYAARSRSGMGKATCAPPPGPSGIRLRETRAPPDGRRGAEALDDLARRRRRRARRRRRSTGTAPPTRRPSTRRWRAGRRARAA